MDHVAPTWSMRRTSNIFNTLDIRDAAIDRSPFLLSSPTFPHRRLSGPAGARKGPCNTYHPLACSTALSVLYDTTCCLYGVGATGYFLLGLVSPFPQITENHPGLHVDVTSRNSPSPSNLHSSISATRPLAVSSSSRSQY